MTIALIAVVGSVVLSGAIMQFRRDRQNRHRIRRYQAWEVGLSSYLFGAEPRHFPPIARKDANLFRTFLARYLPTVGGAEAESLRALYLNLHLQESLPKRLRHRRAVIRAEAIEEVDNFHLTQHLDAVAPLIDDPVPYVAHLAAYALAHSQDLHFAETVVTWARKEEQYQQDRILRILEGFGPNLLPWLEEHLPAPEFDPEPWILFCLLAVSQRHQASRERLLALSRHPMLELQTAAIRALGALGDPETYEAVQDLAQHPAWPVRVQVAKVLGLIAGPMALPHLLKLLGDPVYEVRRNAAEAMMAIGNPGVQALQQVLANPLEDRFARDMARERLEWTEERGHL